MHEIRLKKRLAVSFMINLALILLLIVAVGEAQRNRKLYIDKEAQNGLLTQELNERNNKIECLQKKIKNFEAGNTR